MYACREKLTNMKKARLFLHLAQAWQDKYEDAIILAVFNNKLIELGQVIPGDGDIAFLTTKDKNGRRAYRRSVVFFDAACLAADVSGWDRNFACGTFFGSRLLLPDGGQEGHRLCMAGEFEKGNACPGRKESYDRKKTMKTEDARKLFAKCGMQDKERLMHYRSSSNCNVYELDGCLDYFYGYMAPNTGMLSYFCPLSLRGRLYFAVPGQGDDRGRSFAPANKLFHVMQASEQWGADMGIPTVGALNDAVCAGKTREIILSQEAYMERRIGALAERIVADPDKKFVTIAGPSSSGKTTFSHRLSAQLRALGVTPHPIPLDDYYLDRDRSL